MSSPKTGSIRGHQILTHRTEAEYNILLLVARSRGSLFPSCRRTPRRFVSPLLAWSFSTRTIGGSLVHTQHEQLLCLSPPVHIWRPPPRCAVLSAIILLTTARGGVCATCRTLRAFGASFDFLQDHPFWSQPDRLSRPVAFDRVNQHPMETLDLWRRIRSQPPYSGHAALTIGDVKSAREQHELRVTLEWTVPFLLDTEFFTIYGGDFQAYPGWDTSCPLASTAISTAILGAFTNTPPCSV